MCGLAGIINKTPRKFDYATFCTLGIANDYRGGDSCGVFIDGAYDFGVGEDRFFGDYFQQSELLDDIKVSQIALLHCRKASVGAINAATAQPVILLEDDVVKFVVLHNGTIYNYKELAEKYIPNVDIVGMTDSQVMAHIFYYKGYDVLNEYNGGSAFVIVDYRGKSPRTLLFKGASKKRKYSTEIETERPLYYCIDKSKEELVFSSIGIYLVALRKDCDVYSVRSNELVEFNGTSLVTIKKYSRENCIQTKETGTAITTPYTKGYYYGNWDTYDTNYYSYNSYITCNPMTNTYSYKGSRIMGKLHINQFGYVDQKQKNGIDVYFFDGVALKNANCYRFLTELKKELKLSDTEFVKKFENVIRYLSVDGIYSKNGLWYKAISPTGSALFSGDFHQLTSVTTIRVVSGTQESSYYSRCIKPLGPNFPEKLDLNFKTIKAECKSLMK